jgi:uncharacterized phage protein (TIGR01671 family)
MTRLILFKAKRSDNNEWIFGLPVFLTEYAKDHSEVDGIQCHLTRENYDIEPETLCQFTGIVDVLNNKVFENDICESIFYNIPLPYQKQENNTELIQIVQFSRGSFIMKNRLDYKDFNRRMRDSTPVYYTFSTLNIKVIGNIHD